MSSNKYILKTLGCKANLSDSQVLEDELQKRGWTPQSTFDSQVSLCIVNSCTVTDEADRQTRKLAAKLARDNPQAKIVVTGCGAEVDPEGMAASPGVHFVVGNQNKNQLVELVLNQVSNPENPNTNSQNANQMHPMQGENRVHGDTNPTDDVTHSSIKDISSHILNHKLLGSVSQYKEILSKHPHDREWPPAVDSFQAPPTHLHGSAEKTRAFLKIQEGCNSFCTYCIIPYGRGPSRSLKPRELIEQIRALIQEGIREVVITGTNIGDYGTDWNTEPALGDLLELILESTSLERLRVSSLDPTEITPQILKLMSNNPRFCPHFHVSLQSPHSRILRLMKRKYGADEVKECLTQVSKINTIPGGVFVGMDVITGFPGETEEEFEWGIDSLKNLPWSRLHVFPYSERTGTPATRLPHSVPQHIRTRRSKTLAKLSLDRLTAHYQAVLQECNSSDRPLDAVLLEKMGDQPWVAGYTPNYLRVLIPRNQVHEADLKRNQLISVRPLDLMIDSQAQDVALVVQLI